jgi:transcriptional regulator with XRE-family HTH domain
VTRPHHALEAEAVRLTRELQELTQSQLAAVTGISQPTLSAIRLRRAWSGTRP